MADQNPIPDTGDASTASDPIDQFEQFLAAQDNDGNEAPETEGEQKDENHGEPDDGDQGKDTEPPITTAQLAAFLGVDESEIDVGDDGQPLFKTKIDGKEGKAKFQDFLKTYQLQGHAENRVREAAAKEQAAERKMQEAEQAIAAKLTEQQSSLQQLGQMNAILQHELNGERASINWDALWQDNPAQARALERRFDDRQARINAVFQQIQVRNQQAVSQAEQQRKANEEQTFARQLQRLTELIPEWSDQATANKERAEISEWAKRTSFDLSDFDLTKASQVAALREVWRMKTLQQAKPAIEKKVREAPRLVKPGAAQPAASPNTARIRDLKRQVSAGGNNTRTVAELFKAAGLA